MHFSILEELLGRYFGRGREYIYIYIYYYYDVVGSSGYAVNRLSQVAKLLKFFSFMKQGAGTCMF